MRGVTGSVRRVLLMSSGVVAGLVLTAGVASAHVTIVSPDQPTAGGDAELVLRVPNEDDTASFSKVELDFPQNTPLSNASPEPVPGWSVQVNNVNLKTPVKMAKDTVTQAVGSIVWTAQPGQGIPANDFHSFSFWTEGLPTNTDKLVFTAIQTYDNGKVVTWNQPETPGGAEPDSPAPTLDYAATMSTAAMSTPAAGGSDDLARWLGIGGIALGVIGLITGIAGVSAARRARRVPQ